MKMRTIVYLAFHLLYLGTAGAYTEDRNASPCRSEPCRNGGICIPDGKKFDCICPPDYSHGTFCDSESSTDTSLTERPRNITDVIDSNNSSFTATTYSVTQSMPGTTKSLTFDISVSDSCVPSPCKNGGICSVTFDSFECSCHWPYFGNTCEDVLDLCYGDPCGGNGECRQNQDGYECLCQELFTGLHCEEEVTTHLTTKKITSKMIEEVEINATMSVAVIQSTTGSLMSTATEFIPNTSPSDVCDPNPCKNSGTCFGDGSQFSCICVRPYVGKTCEKDACTPNPCRNNGTCKHLGDGDYKCECKGNFAGRDCESVLDLCAVNPCRHNGICEMHGNSYKCTCGEHFTGNNCETEVTTVTDNTESYSTPVDVSTATKTPSDDFIILTAITGSTLKLMDTPITTEIPLESTTAVEPEASKSISVEVIPRLTTKTPTESTTAVEPETSESISEEDILRLTTKTPTESATVTEPEASTSVSVGGISRITTKPHTESVTVFKQEASTSVSVGGISRITTKLHTESITVFEPEASTSVSVRGISRITTKPHTESVTVFEPGASTSVSVGGISIITTKPHTESVTVFKQEASTSVSVGGISRITTKPHTDLTSNNRNRQQMFAYGGGAAGAILLITLSVVAVFVYRKRMKRRQSKYFENTDSASFGSRSSTANLA